MSIRRPGGGHGLCLELTGAKDVSKLLEELAEWGNADNTPVVKPKK